MNSNMAINITNTQVPALCTGGWNGINTITTITASSASYNGYFNEGKMGLAGSIATNFGNGNYASSISESF
jgi:hypothetical protein